MYSKTGLKKKKVNMLIAQSVQATLNNAKTAKHTLRGHYKDNSCNTVLFIFLLRVWILILSLELVNEIWLVNKQRLDSD